MPDRAWSRPDQCQVAGCARTWRTPQLPLCRAHLYQQREVFKISVEEFVNDPRVEPLPACGPCGVVACIRDRDSPNTAGAGPAVTRASLQADLLGAQQRCARLAAHVQQLEHRLSQALGEQAWRESGLGAPADIDHLNARIAAYEQQVLDLRLQLDERDQDLDAARAANRELIAQLNGLGSR